jgi:hypothetical protein
MHAASALTNKDIEMKNLFLTALCSVLVFGSSPLFADSTEQPPETTENVTTDNASNTDDTEISATPTSNQAASDADDSSTDNSSSSNN